MDADTRKALRSLVEPARAYLRDLDPDLVPHRLRGVVRSSARTLPAPLENSLLEAIADNEALREAVAEKLGEADRSAPFVEAFLDDPQRAIAEAGEMGAAAEIDRLRDRVKALEADNASLRATATEARQRTASEREAFDEDLRQEKAADKRARSSLENRAKSAETARRVAESEFAEVSEELSSQRRRVESLEQDIRRLRSRSMRSDESARRASSGRSAIPTEPAALARWLDDGERVLRPFREQVARGSVDGHARGKLSIPDGVSPDSAEALQVLLAQRPQLVIIDGYNLAGALGHSPIHSAEARAAVIVEASSIRRRSGARVTVVFDAVGVDGRAGFVTDAGVEVIFAMDRLADDEVVDIASESGERVVVVSNDRDVRERAGLAGAVTLWSMAITAGLNS